ncbi:cellulose biosynthesis protein BcsF [Shigella flexneri]
MMTISDIIEIIVVFALIFFPLGLAQHSLRRIRDTFGSSYLLNLRYVKPAGHLRRTEKARASKK